MKIACAATSRLPSSTANSIQVMKTCNALAELGHEVRLWAPDMGRSGWSELAEIYGLSKFFETVTVRTNPAWRRYDFAWKAAREAAAWKADLFYTWLIPAAHFASHKGLPIVLELHDRLMGKLGPRVFQRLLRTKCPVRIAIITQALQAVVEKQIDQPFRPGVAVIAPNGVEIERFGGQPAPGEARRRLGFAEMPTAVFSGHLYPGRGMGLMAELARRMPGVHFIWVGGLEDDVRQWRSALEQAAIRNVTLTGFIENSRLPLYLAAGDVFLMPYDRVITGSSGGNTAEICSPMKMFEYMAVGRAILASDLPAIREVLNDQNAILIPPENIDAWEKALREAVENPDLCGHLGKKVSGEAARYTWQQRQARILSGFSTNPSTPDQEHA